MAPLKLENTAGHPNLLASQVFRVSRRQIYRTRRNIVGLPDSPEWRLRFDPAPEIAFIEPGAAYAFRFNHSGINRVDTDLAWPQFLRQDGGDRINRALSGCVNRSIRRRNRAHAGAYIDHAAPFRSKQFQRFLGRQQKAQNVQIEVVVERFFGDLFQWRKLINPGIVHQDVQLAVSFLGFREKPRDICLLRDISLHRDRLAAAGGDFLYHSVSVFFAGGVINHHRRTLCGQRLRDSSADAFRGPGHYRNLISEFAHNDLLDTPSSFRYLDNRLIDVRAGKKLRGVFSRIKCATAGKSAWAVW